MVEVRAAVEMDGLALRLPLAARVGLRDRLELAAGVNVLLAADPYAKAFYEQDPRSGFPLDNARLSLGLQWAVRADTVGVRVALETRVRSGSVPSASIDIGDMGLDWTIDVRDGLDRPGDLQVIVGVPIHLILGRRLALFGLDELLVAHTFPATRPDIRAGLGLILTPTDPFSLILRHEIDMLQLHPDAVDNRTSITLEAALGRWGDLGLSWSIRRRHHGVFFVYTLEGELLFDEEVTGDASLQLYAEKRF